jgi:hypothetical protein
MMAKAYYFKGISRPEVLKIVVVSRTEIYLASSKTMMKLIDVSKIFYDGQAEREKCLAMTDEAYSDTIIKTFRAQGYSLEKIQDE